MDFAAVWERKLEQINYLMNVADALGQDIIAELNMPQERQRRLIQAKASLFETLSSFFDESSQPVSSLDRVVNKLVYAINDLKARYPENDYIHGLGDRIIKLLQSEDFSKTQFYANQLGVVLSSAGINKRNVLRVVFLNPYACKTNANPVIRISDDKKQWKEIYRGKPLLDSDQPRIEVQLYLQTYPKYIIVDNCDWYGSFNLERVEIINHTGVYLPVSVEAVGKAADEKILLTPGSGYATISHTGGPEQDAIILEFRSL